jgi:hypothetical protein
MQKRERSSFAALRYLYMGQLGWDQPIRHQSNTEYRICSSYPYDAANRSKEHGVDVSMCLAHQPTVQLLKQVHNLMAVARTQVGCFILLRGPHRRLVDTDKIDRQRLSSSRPLQDKVDRPPVNAKKRCLFDMVSRVSVRWSVIERPSQNVCVKRDHWCVSMRVKMEVNFQTPSVDTSTTHPSRSAQGGLSLALGYAYQPTRRRYR